MPFQRFAVAAGFFAALLTNTGVLAAVLSPQASAVCVADALEAMVASPLIDNSQAFSLPAFEVATPFAAVDDDVRATITQDPRRALVAFAMNLRDIRYRRGGRAPSTGFDCSGFVHYVFAHALNVDLPDDSASQFRGGTKIVRNEMQTGDLVFFHTHGKHVSHVGIYLGEGRFIHSPATGERVRIDQLDKTYWLRHFVGAKRPDVLT